MELKQQPGLQAVAESVVLLFALPLSFWRSLRSKREAQIAANRGAAIRRLMEAPMLASFSVDNGRGSTLPGPEFTPSLTLRGQQGKNPGLLTTSGCDGSMPVFDSTR